MNPAYEISAIEDSIVIRLPRSQKDEAFLGGLLDYLEFEATRRRSAISDDECSQLSSDIKEKAWNQVKHLFESEKRTKDQETKSFIDTARSLHLDGPPDWSDKFGHG